MEAVSALMNKILNIYKPVGATPLAMIHTLRQRYPEYAREKIGYAGRLDPLAHGVLLLMVGDATKERDAYLDLPKEYEFEALLGVETDTYDVLGVVKRNRRDVEIVKKNVNLFVKQHVGTMQQVYPPYSSKPVNGKPLFWWARNNRLSDIQIPTREITITKFICLSYNTITSSELHKRVHTIISPVEGDFRQKEILHGWDDFIICSPAQRFHTVTFRLSCSSGTYVRGLVHELGEALGTGAIALDIKRMRVGDYFINDSLYLLHNR